MQYALTPSEHNNKVYLQIMRNITKWPDGVFGLVLKVEYSQISDVVIMKTSKPYARKTTIIPDHNPYLALATVMEQNVQELQFGQITFILTIKNSWPLVNDMDITTQKRIKFKVNRPPKNQETIKTPEVNQNTPTT